jgi:hypothetical protein
MLLGLKEPAERLPVIDAESAVTAFNAAVPAL